ncbi:MAG: hypothetical protein AMJ79_04450 [Phycisphaerae bacterium SM23_30]|nr:MAG: hypothetical protein AMJ79_04450 [Phycisphaerae bacterium SM23_30]
MSLDRSLRSRDALSRHRNVLTRAERLELLGDEGRWTEGQDSVFGLPKVSHRKLAAGKKTKKAKEKEQEQEQPASEGEAASSE